MEMEIRWRLDTCCVTARVPSTLLPTSSRAIREGRAEDCFFCARVLYESVLYEKASLFLRDWLDARRARGSYMLMASARDLLWLTLAW